MDEMLTLESRVKLNDGHSIPVLGLGVFQLEDEAVCERAVRTALELGYRHIDTAAIYGNEAAVGRAIRDSGVAREELFVTTKCWFEEYGRAETRRAFDESRRRLGLDVIDLYLLHWPVDATMMGAWDTLLELKDEGVARSIGVSNFTVRRFEEFFFKRTNVVPAVNQIEAHVYASRRDVQAYCEGRRMVVEAYSPLTRMKEAAPQELSAVAEESGCSVAQVMLRWHLQHGRVVIPKSQHPERLRENADVFGFELSAAQMARLDALNEDRFIITWRPGGAENWY